MKRFKEKYGPWALVTGASGGIGEQFAHQIASKGLDVVLVARNAKKLAALKEELSSSHQVEAKIIAADLSTESGIDAVITGTADLEIGLLVNNVGREDSDHFLNIPIANHLQTIDLNVRTPMVLTHHFGAKMVEKKRGGVISMSSIVAFQGVPLIANYAGTKAYSLIFFESVAAEFEKHKIDVLVTAPGFTDTKLGSRYDFSGTPMKPLAPEFVARKAISQLGRKRLSIPGVINGFLYWSGKRLFSRARNTKSFGSVFSKVLHKSI